MPARTVTAILARDGLPRPYELDMMTGEVIRSSKAAAVRYERDRPGGLVHVDAHEDRPDPRRRRPAGPRASGRAQEVEFTGADLPS